MELKSNNLSVKYHDIFDFKLVKSDFPKWSCKAGSRSARQYKRVIEKVTGVKNKNRLQREKYSKNKLKIAKNAASLISRIPTVLFVGVTGSLAMMNSGRGSDIDLIIITKNGRLWTTRLISYLVTWLLGFKTRKPKSKFEKDRLCLNMWLDESDLIWDKKERNIYTAHEIAQIIPLVNKEKTYEKFLRCNRWILNYWPNAVDAKYIGRSISYIGKTKTQYTIYNILYTFVESLAYKLQYFYMKSKITREVVTPTRAIFHPNDLAKVILDKLST